MTEAIPLPPPGWYPDGVTPGVLRWFDGAAWSERTVPVPPTPALAPVSGPVPVTGASPAAPASAAPATVAAAAPAVAVPVAAAAPAVAVPVAAAAPAVAVPVAAAAPAVAVPGVADAHDAAPWRTPGAHTAAGVVAPAHARRPVGPGAPGPGAPGPGAAVAQPYAVPAPQPVTQPGTPPAAVAPAPATWGPPQTTAWYPEQPRPGSSPRDSLHWLVPVGRSWQSIVAGYLGLLAIVVWPLGPVALVFGIWAMRKAQVGGHGRGRAVLALVVGVLATIALVFVAVSFLTTSS